MMKEIGSEHYYTNNTLANIHPSFLISFYVFNPNLQIESQKFLASFWCLFLFLFLWNLLGH